MVIVFNAKYVNGIWMKAMNFSIDIIWLNENFDIVDIKKNAKPSSFPEVFRPKISARYVIEVGAGFSDIYNIEIGDSAGF